MKVFFLRGQKEPRGTDRGGFARFSLVKEGEKFLPRLDLFGPFIAGRDVSIQRKWSILLHEFTHYKQWLRGVAPNEFFLTDRNIGETTWKEEARMHFEFEIEANKVMFNFLDAQRYDGYDRVGHKDDHYQGWKSGKGEYIVQFVYKNLVKQVVNDPAMLKYLSDLAEGYAKKEKAP